MTALKTSIEHLPEDKQSELKEIQGVIRKRLAAEMIILFGSFARGDWVDDRYKENGTTYEYKSDFDILVVLANEEQAVIREFGKRLRRKIRRNSPQETPLNIIFHGIEYLNQEIEEGNYFFVDVLKEGIILYDRGRFQLSTPKLLSVKQRKDKAQLYFDKWFENANNVLKKYQFSFNENILNEAAFDLHQATERLYMCILLVYTDYKPKVHDLDKLDKEVCKLDNRFKTIFPRTTLEEERLFTLLKKAYIDSRYKLNYTITKEDLEYLFECVTRLRNLTEKACKEKIESFE